MELNAVDNSGIVIDEAPVDQVEILRAFLALFGTNNPTLEQIWAAMDFVWESIGCDNRPIHFLQPRPGPLAPVIAWEITNG